MAGTHHSPSATHSLWQLPPGETGVITGFDGRLAASYRVRLMELGFHLGESVTCLQAPGLGAPRVYRVSNSVFSLDDEVAGGILVGKAVAHP